MDYSSRNTPFFSLFLSILIEANFAFSLFFSFSYSLPLVITASEEKKKEMTLCCKCGTDKRRSEFSCTQFSKHPASDRTCKTCNRKFPKKPQVVERAVEQDREESSEPYLRKDKTWSIPWYCGECLDDDFPCSQCLTNQDGFAEFLESYNKDVETGKQSNLNTM